MLINQSQALRARWIVTTTVLLFASNFLSGQTSDLYFVSKDSVIIHSVIGQEKSRFADSIYNYHFENLNKEVKLFQVDIGTFLRMVQGGSIIAPAFLEAEQERFRALRESLQKQEEGLKNIHTYLNNEFAAFAKATISTLSKSYAQHHGLTRSLILDSSALEIYAYMGNDNYYLTKQIINEIDRSVEVRERLENLKSALALEVAQIICKE